MASKDKELIEIESKINDYIKLHGEELCEPVRAYIIL